MKILMKDDKGEDNGKRKIRRGFREKRMIKEGKEGKG